MIVNDILVKHQNGREQSLLSHPLYITSLTGLGIEVQQTSTKLFGIDGSIVNTETLNERTITLKIQNFERVHTSHNEWVQELFPLREDFELIIRGTMGAVSIARKIVCRLKKLKSSEFTEDDSYDVQLTCNDPYFHDENAIGILNSSSQAAFHFPFSVRKSKPILFGRMRTSQRNTLYNTGSIEVGFLTYVSVLPEGNEISGIKIYSLQSPEKFILVDEGLKLQPGQTLVIDTNERTAGIHLIEVDGTKSNVLYYLNTDTTFFQLPKGQTDLVFEITNGDVGYVDVLYSYNNSYAGV